MTLTEFTLKWSNTWRFDYWWRKKYNIPFGSEAHRNISQIDIKMEYIENHYALKQIDKHQNDEERLKEYKETGRWLRVSVDETKEKELFDKMDLSKF